MGSRVAQFCLNVTDLERSVAFYTALGLECTRRTELDDAWNAFVEHSGYGGRFQIRQEKAPTGAFDRGNAFWKMYVNTSDMDTVYTRAVAAGAEVDSPPQRMERWPVTIAFVRDPDGYIVEFVQRDPWPDGAPLDAPWFGQYCITVTDLDATVAFYEVLGLTCTSRTEIPHAFEAIVENPAGGGKIQLAQQRPVEPLHLGSVAKLFIATDDCADLHTRAVAAGHRSLAAPRQPDGWPVTVALVEDPDGYPIELIEVPSTD